MQNTWILDVLTDLRQFAEQNKMHGVAEHLAETHRVARTEISTVCVTPRAANDRRARAFSGEIGAR